MEDEKIRELRDEALELNEQAKAIQKLADEAKRPLTEDEEKEVDSICARFEGIQEEIRRRNKIEEHAAQLSQSAGRRAEPQEPGEAAKDEGEEPQPIRYRAKKERPTGNAAIFEERGKWGWSNLGEFALAVRRASAPTAPYFDPRLVRNAPTSTSSTGVGEDGGFAVPTEWRSAIWEKVAGEASLFSRTDQNPASRNTIVFPGDETTPWQTTGGIQANWEGEGDQLAQSKVALVDKSIRLNKLTALVPVTEELLEDAPALGSYISRKVALKFDFKLNLAIVQGTGVGQPTGILNHGSLVSVAKETSQPADTILAENIMKMWSRLYGEVRGNAVWLINQDVEPQLWGMHIKVKNVAGTENVGGTPVYMPAGGLSGAPYATLFNRPVLPTQACNTLGDKGDVILCDLSQYMTAYKIGGMRSDVSMHLWFDYDVLAFRFILRVAGQPWWASTIAPRSGSASMGWAVTLDERS
jgi:HK97 family phage major capsid protein